MESMKKGLVVVFDVDVVAKFELVLGEREREREREKKRTMESMKKGLVVVFDVDVDVGVDVEELVVVVVVVEVVATAAVVLNPYFIVDISSDFILFWFVTIVIPNIMTI